jgi:hypothetical protein
MQKVHDRFKGLEHPISRVAEIEFSGKADEDLSMTGGTSAQSTPQKRIGKILGIIILVFGLVVFSYGSWVFLALDLPLSDFWGNGAGTFVIGSLFILGGVVTTLISYSSPVVSTAENKMEKMKTGLADFLPIKKHHHDALS